MLTTLQEDVHDIFQTTGIQVGIQAGIQESNQVWIPNLVAKKPLTKRKEAS
jgi:hypothetical protein